MPSPAAGAPPTVPTTPRGPNPTSLPPEALPEQLRVGPWRIYALIGGVALVASFAVVAALFFATREPSSAERTESATRFLAAHATPSAAPTTLRIATATATVTATAAPTATTPPAPTANATPTPTPTPTPTATPTPTPTATSPAPTAPPLSADEGTITTPPTAAGHRVFVDGRYAGDSPGPIKVRCGERLVKIGSGGTPHTVNVPCGSDLLVQPR